MLYNNLSAYLRKKYGGSIGKICIDGGFSCPNRDGKCGTGGCIYCGERGAGEHIDPTLSIREQVKKGLSAGKKDGYIAYFQNFTNTYETAGVLKERYDAALISEKILALAIGTRPDCISEEICELISSYKNRIDVWVEIGLQTASDSTAALINRGYKLERYFEAAKLLKRWNIPFVTHMIIGLPTEGEEEALETVGAINSSGADGIKIHSLYVMKGTRLAEMYYSGEVSLMTREEYVRIAAKVIASLKPTITVHRITGDCPRDMLVAPEWNRDKNGTIQKIRETLEANGMYQGSLYKE